MSLLRVEFPAIGTTAVVVAHAPDELVTARDALEHVLARIDLACSRFRADSEIWKLAGADGEPVPVSATLFDAVTVALRAAAATDGLVDPTIGPALVSLGYDRDFADIDESPVTPAWPAPAVGWQTIVLDAGSRTVAVPAGLVLDLGATAKALAVDMAASAVSARCRSGVLIGVGGDLAVAGPPPPGGWAVRIAESHLAPEGQGDPVIALHGGALATSSTTVRNWGPATDRRHHIVDPRTGSPAGRTWRSVSVAAASCVDANTASTAAVVLGDVAPSWLAARQLPSRLVRADGPVIRVAGWPDEEVAA